jgi:hypothetical protein
LIRFEATPSRPKVIARDDGTQKMPATIALMKPKAANSTIMSIFRVRLIGSLLG